MKCTLMQDTSKHLPQFCSSNPSGQSLWPSQTQDCWIRYPTWHWNIELPELPPAEYQVITITNTLAKLCVSLLPWAKVEPMYNDSTAAKSKMAHVKSFFPSQRCIASVHSTPSLTNSGAGPSLATVPEGLSCDFSQRTATVVTRNYQKRPISVEKLRDAKIHESSEPKPFVLDPHMPWKVGLE